MNCSIRGDDAFRPFPRLNGFSVEASPVNQALRDTPDAQPITVETLLALKPIPSIEFEKNLPLPTSIMDSSMVPGPADNLHVSFTSSASEPMFDVSSILSLGSSSSLFSLDSKASCSSSGEMDLADTSLSSLDSGSLSIMGPITPPRRQASYADVAFQPYTFEEEWQGAFESMHISPAYGVPAHDTPLVVANDIFGDSFGPPRGVLGSWNAPVKIDSVKGAVKTKKKGTTSRRRHLGKENIDPNFRVY